MPNLTAAEYAAILDPEHEIDDWWHYSCPECGETHGGHSYACFDTPEYEYQYYGPDDLHTAREHAWRGEDWLEARGYSVRRTAGYTAVYTQGYPFFDAPFNMSHQNHAAAIAEAVRRIANG